MKLVELLNMKETKYRLAAIVSPKDTISETIRKMIEHDRGALPVCNEKGELVGIITERDIVRKCFSHSGECSKIKVQDVMSKKIVIGQPEDNLDYAMSVMKHERIRHLPLVDDKNKVIGMISMRDLLGVTLEESNAKVRYLNDYISGGFT